MRWGDKLSCIGTTTVQSISTSKFAFWFKKWA